MDDAAQPFAATSDLVEVALLDATGVVVAVNDAWIRFGQANGAPPEGIGLGMSYLDVCAAAGDDPYAQQAEAAIKSALVGDLPAPLHLRFPFDASDEQRWFEMLVASRFDDRATCVGATLTITPALPPRTSSDEPQEARDLGRPGPQNRLRRHPPSPHLGSRLEAVLKGHASMLAAREETLVVRRLVRAAVDLVAADHGTLGVLGADGTFTRFLDDVTESGFRGPENAPRGGEVLVVPVPVRDGIFGILYLTRRGPGFGDGDERLVGSLAVSAGTAIDNVRMREDTERRRAWQAVSTVAVSRLFTADEGLPLDTVLQLAIRGADADFATMTALTADDEVVVEAAAGAVDEGWLTTRWPLTESLVAGVLRNGEPVLVDLARQAVPNGDGHRGIRSVMAAPLVRRGGRVVALVAGRRTGRQAFDHVDLEHLAAYAGYAGSALDVHRARNDREKLLLLEEHDRIAADLHGQIVKDLFITGMGLQGLVPEVASREVQRRLLGYVDELDATIHRIRSTVFERQEQRQGVDGDQ